MTTFDLMRTLQGFERDYYTVADLEKITKLSRSSLKVALSRLTEKGALTRLKRGVYASGEALINVPKVANQLYYPSYLSFESALSRFGIVSQMPATETFASLKQTKRMNIFGTAVEFRQMKPNLFFGYRLENGLSMAEPEKALLDMLYMVARGKGNIDVQELDLRSIDRKKFTEYAKKFPRYMEPLLQEAKQYIGTAAITLETKERIL